MVTFHCKEKERAVWRSNNLKNDDDDGDDDWWWTVAEMNFKWSFEVSHEEVGAGGDQYDAGWMKRWDQLEKCTHTCCRQHFECRKGLGEEFLLTPVYGVNRVPSHCQEGSDNLLDSARVHFLGTCSHHPCCSFVVFLVTWLVTWHGCSSTRPPL